MGRGGFIEIDRGGVRLDEQEPGGGPFLGLRLGDSVSGRERLAKFRECDRQLGRKGTSNVPTDEEVGRPAKELREKAGQIGHAGHRVARVALGDRQVGDVVSEATLEIRQRGAVNDDLSIHQRRR